MNGTHSRGTLENLIPLAVVICGGCEPCAERMVKQALTQGTSFDDIDATLNILADMQKRECVSQALGTEFQQRMTRPLAAGRKTLEQARAESSSGCGCAVSSRSA